MAENDEKINQLLEKLEDLLKKQENFGKEINVLKGEVNNLRSFQAKDKTKEQSFETAEKVIKTDAGKAGTEVGQVAKIEPGLPIYQADSEKTVEEKQVPPTVKSSVTKNLGTDLEKFIGENLINKIGIGVTVIGVAIGAKYSIEHQLISPQTRILLGYLMGIALLAFGIKLKKNFEKYSAVLVSGAMAILYFITYSAFGIYDLMPQSVAFLLMVIFTAFTVFAALKYNQQVIAHIGLVGAYAVPFLLSEDTGKVAVLYSYMSIINVGILIIGFKRYWKSLFYSSFILTWVIFLSWYVISYHPLQHFALALFFISVFFVTYYSIFLAYKLLQKEKFDAGDIVMVLSNSFIFYGLGFSILDSNTTGSELLGLFTLLNALMHFGISMIIYRNKLADRNLFYLIIGLVLVFITLAIPVQLNGNWVTLLWAFEAALLFWIGRTKRAPVYEMLSYILIILASFSIVHDWFTLYDNYNAGEISTRVIPFFTVNFLSSLLFAASFAFLCYIQSRKKYLSPGQIPNILQSRMSYFVPAVLVIVLYNTFRLEISTYWNQLYLDSAIIVTGNNPDYPDKFFNLDLGYFKTVWVINYSLLFCSVLSFLNIKKIQSSTLGFINLALNALFVIIFLGWGLYTLSLLRDSYLHSQLPDYFQASRFNLGIRYISFVFVALILVSCYRYINQEFIKKHSPEIRVLFDILLYTSVLWIVSSELINWLDIRQYSELYRLGLTILWGVYSLLLVVLGIWKNKKHLRIVAIALFAVTLVKLFFYDISHLKTIPKTIVFVSLGILLLVISFLYNKFRNKISETNVNH